MKESPIIFSESMVKAILDGRKTITRRILDKQLPACNHGVYEEAAWKDEPTNFRSDNEDLWYCTLCGNGTNIKGEGFKCRYGKVGDLLYVKENFQVQQVNVIHDGQWMNHICLDFPASFGKPTDELRKWFWIPKDKTPKVIMRKHPDKIFTSPSIFLPKECSRIWLKIIDIRAERLKDISETDAIKEGAMKSDDSVYPYRHLDFPNSFFGDARIWFENLWKEINGVEKWEANPWVWAIEFKVLSTSGRPSVSKGAINRKFERLLFGGLPKQSELD